MRRARRSGRLTLEGSAATAFAGVDGAAVLRLAAQPAAVPSALVDHFGAFTAIEGIDSLTRTGEPSGAIVHGLTAANVAELRPLLDSLYGCLPAGAPVVVVDPPRLASARDRRDLLSTALFAAGLELVGFTRVADDSMVVLAHRSGRPAPGERPFTLSVVMPVYNEQGTVDKVLEELLAKTVPGVEIETVIVESNSTDGTRERVLAYEGRPGVRIVLEDVAQGKGHAVRAGFAAASGDFVMIQDADLEYDISDYDGLLVPLRNYETSFVLGYRTRTDGARLGVRHFEKQVLIGILMNVGNAFFLRLFNTVYRSHLRDPFTMYKVFRRDCLAGLHLECNRFDFDWELTGKLLRRGFKPVELPVSYQSRSFSEGKKVSIFGDPWSWIVACFKYRFASLDEPAAAA